MTNVSVIDMGFAVSVASIQLLVVVAHLYNLPSRLDVSSYLLLPPAAVASIRWDPVLKKFIIISILF